MKYNKGFPPFAQRVGDFGRDHVLLYMRRERSEKKRISRQIAEMYHLLRFYRQVPHHYLTYELYLRDCAADVRAFVPPGLLRRFIARINPLDAASKVEDKRIFAALMREAGLPHIPLIATITKDGSIRDADGKPLPFDTLLETLHRSGTDRVFAKPAEGANGVGHFIAVVGADGLNVGGRNLRLPDLLDRMFGDELFDDYMLQPVATQHEVLQRLNPASVNTIRIDTFVLDGHVHHDGAVFRIGGGGTYVDNWAAGGYLAKIDLETGALGPTAKSKAKYGRRVIRAHPVTAVVLEGLRLPYWDEAKNLAARAARVVEPLRYVGWDIALTNEGPIVIEGNHPSDVSMLQYGVGGLRDTPFGAEVMRSAGVAKGDGKRRVD
jgi:Sugar-transfer associated ATP-grasp